MKKIFGMMALAALFLVACGDENADHSGSTDSTATADQTHQDENTDSDLPDRDATGNFGATISGEDAIPSSELVAHMGEQDSMEVTVSGAISEVCQAKGCWMTLPLNEEEDMMVKFKGYEYFVPRGSAGKQAVVKGWAYREMVEVDELRHLAMDGGMTEKEAEERYPEPEMRLTFMADGVIIE